MSFPPCEKNGLSSRRSRCLAVVYLIGIRNIAIQVQLGVSQLGSLKITYLNVSVEIIGVFAAASKAQPSSLPAQRPGENDLLRARIPNGSVDLAGRLHLRGGEARRLVAVLALDHFRIEMAEHGISISPSLRPSSVSHSFSTLRGSADISKEGSLHRAICA